ncbi:MarR family winged helix-turn-helix transcriptional regulator [Aeromicrobium terrae]|uniref:MarR family transcriptional regulator n=1 Tax=Aeromicrobium terrae TaxID=2498846 RepID=A0A5C8NK74_9ACTN|nr:MarR family transcriptional regulator [Aeromicrobium terrae]TXL62169.1 MarR family transcriptional regulator [Aeromicrobium terrae]
MSKTRPSNVVLLLREAYLRLNDLVVTRLEEAGHADVRPAHAAVFQFLDDDGTTVSTLAQRARMTKQAMAQLVEHLESHQYVERVPDPGDRRAKLVVVTSRGREVLDIAQSLVPDVEGLVTSIIGAQRTKAMRADLEKIRQADLTL